MLNNNWIGKRNALTKIKSVTVGVLMTRYDPGLGCATSARLLIMRPVTGKSSCPCVSRELWLTKLVNGALSQNHVPLRQIVAKI